MLKTEIKGKIIFLKIKSFDIEFAKLLLKTLDENREYLEKWLDWVSETKTLDQSLNLLQEYKKGFENKKLMNYSIFLADEYIGDIAMFNIDWNKKECEIGYWIIEKESNKGYTTEAITLIEHEIYNNWKFEKIIIKCENNNKSSNYLAKKFSYTFENEQKDRKITYLVYSKLKK